MFFLDILQHLIDKQDELIGEWIKKNASYEQDICKILDMLPQRSRYYDATWGPYFIEFKKGKSVWLDLVRYSETLLKTNEDSMKETVTAFFVPSKDKMKIEEIILVETSSIVNALSLDKETAEIISSLNDKLPRSLNAQASLTLGDLRNISINTKLLKAIKAQKIT